MMGFDYAKVLKEICNDIEMKIGGYADFLLLDEPKNPGLSRIMWTSYDKSKDFEAESFGYRSVNKEIHIQFRISWAELEVESNLSEIIANSFQYRYNEMEKNPD